MGIGEVNTSLCPIRIVITMLIDNEVFFDPVIPKVILTSHGWNIKDLYIKDEVLFFKADFYDNGFVLAESNNATITSEGETLFFIDDVKYTSVFSAVDKLGFSILESILEWDWKIEKEWVVNKNGAFITTFTKLYECPKR
jgi:hypothetical protein